MLLKKLFYAILLMLPMIGFAQEQNNWFVSQSEAIEYAETNNVNILMVFAGSDWCRPCIKLKKDVLENEVFLESSTDNLCILYLDFPSKKKNKLSKEQTLQNEGLAELYNPSGFFPKIVLMDSHLNKIKDINYKGENVSDFSNLIYE
jgi:thioredoxin-related protein